MKKISMLNQIRQVAFVVLALTVLSYQFIFAQSTTPNGVELSVRPTAPLQFQFFPISLLGIGKGDANLSAFQNFGVQLTNNTGTSKDIWLKVDLTDGSTSLFSQKLEVALTIPGGTYFIGTPQLLNAKSVPYKKTAISGKNPNISKDYIDKLKGGLPSGTFEFVISIADYAPYGAQNYAASPDQRIIIQILAGSTVDVIMPANGTTVNSLPQFQWSAVGGQKFKLAVAKLKPNQSQEDALNSSAQRVVLELNGTSYQTVAGGPVSGAGVKVEDNNLTWNPGLADGDYCYRVTMIQEDPITGTQNLVNSNIAGFTVSGSGGTVNTSGLNTDEIIGLLMAAAKGADIAKELKGYSAFSIEINKKPATVDELRAKLNDISSTAKWSIKP